MATLENRTISSTYKGLLNIDNSNAGIDGTLRSVQDGEGTTCPLQLASDYVNITALKYNGNIISVAGAVTFAGAYACTITLAGTTTLTLPVSGTIVTSDSTVTLTNKTITAPTITTPTITNPTITGGGTWASPVLTTPTLGVASATTINKVTITAPATGSTLTIADGKTLTASNTLTFTGTDASSVAFGTGGTVVYSGGNLSQFAATTSSELRGVISDETGTGALVFATSPTLVTPALGTPASGTLTNCTGYPGIPAEASKAEQETSTATTVFVSPAKQQYHPSAAKVWCQATFVGTAAASYNVSSITDSAAGQIGVNYTVAMSSTTYTVVATCQLDQSNTSATTVIAQVLNSSFSTGACYVNSIVLNTFAKADSNYLHVAVFGDQ